MLEEGWRMLNIRNLSSPQWCNSEFSAIDLGDGRRDIRFMKVALQLSQQVSSSVNQACVNWNETKAAYRLFENEKVTSSEILEPHQLMTVKRMESFPLILAIQDTTYLNYSNHVKTSDLGLISASSRDRGLLMHTTLACTPEGLPLGVLSQEIWARKKKGPVRFKRLHNKQIPIEDKESYKWLKAMEDTTSLSDVISSTVVHVGDREADIYEYIVKATELDTSFLIRVCKDRLIKGLSKSATTTLWEHMTSLPNMGTVEVEVQTKKPSNKRRTARLEIRFCKIELQPPGRRPPANSKSMPPVCVYTVWLSEKDPPKGEVSVDWMLMTNVAVNDLDDATQRAQWYSIRWRIESFHKVLKSGCRVEDCRLGSAEKLQKYLTLFTVIAWRLFFMTYINREDPQQPCDVILCDHEWKALYCKIHRAKKAPTAAPSLNQAIRWIAQLGGFLARKGDGDPGIVTIWRGWQRLADISEMWLCLQST
jgi:hypothetical protein